MAALSADSSDVDGGIGGEVTTIREQPAVPDPGAALQVLATRIPTLTGRDQVLDALLEATTLLSGADCAAVLERTALDGLRRMRDIGAGLTEMMAIGDVRSALWSVLLGRSQLIWEVPEQAPAPLHGIAGWERGVVLRIASRRGPAKLLALGGVTISDPAILPALQAMADIAAPSIESIELITATRRSQGLLRRVTELAGDLGAAVSPAQLLDAMVRGLSGLEGVTGAVVWCTEGAAAGGIEVLASAPEDGVPSTGAVLTRVERLLNPATGRAARALVASAARLAQTDQLLSMMTLHTEPARVLGIIHDQPLDDLSQGVLASLASAVGPAMREVEMAAERRTLLAGYTRALLPSARPAGLDLAIEHHPNTSAPGSFGGDFYDWFEVADNHFVIALVDVSGKGISAASAASMVVWSLRAVGGRGAQPTVMAHLLNGIVAQELDEDRFVTLALLTVDGDTWDARLLLAGHPAPLVVHGGSVTVPVTTPLPPLGVAPVISAAAPTTLSLAAGDALVLFTDGVTEAVGPDGERFGVGRLQSRTSRMVIRADWTAKGLAAALWSSVHDWAGGPPDDDCAILVVRRPA
ncbi:hypothetical protein BH23ACT9_BH23ACT9_30010 [soil metagenome]